MNENYDVIACGTGFKECLLSGLLSVSGKKVLHVDRNSFYGGECASINITQFFETYMKGPPPAELGPNRDWNIDLIPKFIMADGLLVKTLVYTKVSETLNFQLIGGSYVFKDKKVDKVPSTTGEAMTTSLVGFFEKNHLKNFLSFVNEWVEKPTDKKFNDIPKLKALDTMKQFKLDPATMTFIGHAMALEPDDSYLEKGAEDFFNKLALYANSISKFKDQNSPYLYPMYGLGDLPQAFARLCAVWGGTYMLNTSVDEILVDGSGKATGIRSGDQSAHAPIVIGDPSYFKGITGKTQIVGKIVRAICLINHVISPMKNPVDSANIIIPQSEVGRHHDIYVCYTSSQQKVCPAGWYIALVSTTVETEKPEAELEPGLKLLGDIKYKHVEVHDVHVPVISGKQDGMFCSASYDPTTHFETTIQEVLKLYEEIMGKPVDFSTPPRPGA